MENDVEQVPSPAVEAPQEVTPEVQEQVETPSVPQPQGDVDELGVPWKNRAMEKERKLNELVDSLPKLIEDTIKSTHKPNNEREYTIAELEQYAIDNPSYRPWVEEKKAEIISKRSVSALNEQLKTERQKTEEQMTRQQSLQYVQQNYPEAFDQRSPLAQQMNIILSDPRLKNDPNGIAIAADIAFARTTRNSKQTQVLKQEVKSLQKRTFVEGGGKPSAPATPAHQAALDKLKKTGSVRDMAAALRLLQEKYSQGE